MCYRFPIHKTITYSIHAVSSPVLSFNGLSDQISLIHATVAHKRMERQELDSRTERHKAVEYIYTININISRPT